MITNSDQPSVVLSCYHCGQPCDADAKSFQTDGHRFCCFGCKTIYEILRDNDLCTYYTLNSAPGINQASGQTSEAYEGLDNPEVSGRLLTFTSSTLNRAVLDIPGIHCVSCIWLLENLNRLEPGIIRSEVNFPRKQVTVSFRPETSGDHGISLRRVAVLLASVGYPPRITLHTPDAGLAPAYNRKLLLKLAVAAFSFGNIMLLSFPEYLGLSTAEKTFTPWFGMLNIALALPVLLFSASDYLVSAGQALRSKRINLDVPLALGMLALFLRSVYDIATATGPGYLDSFAGLLFFLLIGRWFQNVTFENLSFDRDYRSFFPLTVQKISPSGMLSGELVSRLSPGDQILIRNQEIIPCDSQMLDDEALADYSFVTGESRPVLLRKGDLVYAGGRIIGMPVHLMVRKEIRQGHLTSLWNSDAFTKPREVRFKRLADRTARRFTWILLAIAFISALCWWYIDPSRIWLVVTSILIVVCPCALALSAPFTFGTMMRVFGRQGLYLKNADVLERMGNIQKIIFDKTGTLTTTRSDVSLEGGLEEEEMLALVAVSGASTHPLSIRIHEFLKIRVSGRRLPALVWMEEYPGKGISARLANGYRVRLGSAVWLLNDGAGQSFLTQDISTAVYAEIDGRMVGRFFIHASLRPGLADLLNRLGSRCLALVSGDGAHDKGRMEELFPAGTELRFQQSPAEKMEYVSGANARLGDTVMMVGDGLNDSGALRQSAVGLAVTDDVAVFTPSCDAIIQGTSLTRLDWFLDMSRRAGQIVRACFFISVLYNAAGLAFAVSGFLTPLVAAILMPLSSLTVVVFTTLSVRWVTRNQPKSV